MAEKTAAKAPKKPNAFLGFFKKIAKYFRDCKGEIKRIVWPTPQATFKNTGIVLVVVIIATLFVFGLDIGFMNLLGLVMDISTPV